MRTGEDNISPVLTLTRFKHCASLWRDAQPWPVEMSANIHCRILLALSRLWRWDSWPRAQLARRTNLQSVIPLLVIKTMQYLLSSYQKKQITLPSWAPELKPCIWLHHLCQDMFWILHAADYMFQSPESSCYVGESFSHSQCRCSLAAT